jgi:hypothetical protein
VTSDRPVISDTFFELIKLLEFDYVCNDEKTMLRVEIFHSVDPFNRPDRQELQGRKLFRGRIWELVATQSTPVPEYLKTNADNLFGAVGDRLTVDRTYRYGMSHKIKYEGFYARDLQDATHKIQEDITYSIMYFWSLAEEATLDYEIL